jgi:hypothetical protein
MNKYLPSKKFLYLLGSFVVLALIFFITFKLLSSKSSFFSPKEAGSLNVDRLAQAGLTVNDLVKKDSDSDGISDWEEALWGTDKNNQMTFNGITDKAYIAGKKKELNVDQTKDENGLTETEKFAREFFASYVAMKASGTMDATAINNFSSALGEKIVSPNLVDRYSIKDIKINSENTLESKKAYYSKVKTLFEKYKTKGIGDELGIVENQVNSTESTESTSKLTPIAQAYKDFATDTIKISVPSDLSTEHLKIINSANNTGISVFNLVKVVGDPIVGLSGLSQYEKYSGDLVNAVGELETKIK